MKILVAGIGNIFFGDDAFGCEVVKALLARPQREGVRVIDFGIRSYDLAYAMMEDYDATILIDASPRGERPGTLYVIQPEIKRLDTNEDEVLNAHSMNPVRVLQLVHSLGGQPRNLFVIGCEPKVLESPDGQMGLSENVRAAIAPAMEMIDRLITQLIEGRSAGISTTKHVHDQISQRSEVR